MFFLRRTGNPSTSGGTRTEGMLMTEHKHVQASSILGESGQAGEGHGQVKWQT